MASSKRNMKITTFIIAVLAVTSVLFVAIPDSSSVKAESNSIITKNITSLNIDTTGDQTIESGDYVLYDVTVNGETGTRRYDFLTVSDTEMTVQVTSTIWYFGSYTHSYDYSYENDQIIIWDLTGYFNDTNKIGGANIQTAYGSKNITIFSYWLPGPYSNALRTYYVPVGCSVFFKYYGNDTDGNHVVQTLQETNIAWLRSVGASEVPIEPNSEQTVKSGDYVLYDVTVNGETGTRRYDFLTVSDTEMTVQVTSTIWYFGSYTHSYDYSYENDQIIIWDLTGSFNNANKVGVTDIQTAYGHKNITIFSYWLPGPYSNALRTYYVPVGCSVFFKYYGNDTDGNHVVQTLQETNIAWLRSVGATEGPIEQDLGISNVVWVMVIGGIAAVVVVIAVLTMSRRRSDEKYNHEVATGSTFSSSSQQSIWTCPICYSRNDAKYLYCSNCGTRKR